MEKIRFNSLVFMLAAPLMLFLLTGCGGLSLGITDEQLPTVYRKICRGNPKPGLDGKRPPAPRQNRLHRR